MANFRYILLFLLFIAPFQKAAANEAPPQTFSVMTYNVENLFDTQHDAGKDDYAFLPMQIKLNQGFIKKCKGQRFKHYREECERLDWTDSLLETKLQRLAQVITDYDEKGADIVVLEEVENLQVLKMLQKKLVSSNYQTIILKEDDDRRGIDIGVLSRFKELKPARLANIDFASWFEKPKPFKKGRQLSRGFLQIYLEGPGQSKITLFGVHLPSQMSPTAERERAIETLNVLGEEAAKEFPIVLAAGDFNIDGDESGQLYRGMIAPMWHVSHLRGCHTCSGTYYYDKQKTWSFFDAILQWSPKNAKDHGPWTMQAESIQVIKHIEGQINEQGIPQRFNYEIGSGFSDHLPLAVRFNRVTF